ncbi:hypothetical protein EVAR_18718_1 [Eumeta japonica]|uniref:Uncharacterized protein n=1 Tax=Eumeta variegata TaxID=151549 RepID=A0A4C1UM65_EUMVA|nr:hypothetical protein EVAR_18718_1 [Eumeta japonica]
MVYVAVARKWTGSTSAIRVPHSHRIQPYSKNFRFSVSSSESELRWPTPLLSPHSLPPTTLSFLHQFTPSSVKYPIRDQEPSNVLVTTPESRQSITALPTYKYFGDAHALLFLNKPKVLNDNQPREQVGFRIGRVKIWQALKNQAVENKYSKILKSIYLNTKAKIKLEKAGKEIEIEKRVRQDNPISPKLFSATLKWAGYIIRGTEKLSQSVMYWVTSDGQRNGGTLLRRWVDEIRAAASVTWSRKARNRKE